MNSLLFLCHRIPYPPDKGDKIRSFHLLRALSRRFDVHLGAFVDLEDDWRHAEALRAMVAGLQLCPLPRRVAIARSATGFLTGEPLSLPFYRSARLARWVRETLEARKIDVAFIFSSAMGQYLPERRMPLEIVDFCDVDSDKWRRYAETKSWPLARIYAREARLLADYERRLAGRSDWSLFVSDSESRLFAEGWPEGRQKIVTVRNGVDTDYFCPVSVADRQPIKSPSIVFTGAMDYEANIDAVTWFAMEVWPIVRMSHPSARFRIVGARPAASVRQLARVPGVDVTGRVADVRPYLACATAAVAPLRIARGVQNKVLEALAMAKPVVATPAALTGLDGAKIPGLYCARTAREFVAQLAQLFDSDAANARNDAGRLFVREHYGWDSTVSRLLQLVENTVIGAVRPT